MSLVSSWMSVWSSAKAAVAKEDERKAGNRKTKVTTEGGEEIMIEDRKKEGKKQDWKEGKKERKERRDGWMEIRRKKGKK